MMPAPPLCLLCPICTPPGAAQHHRCPSACSHHCPGHPLSPTTSCSHRSTKAPRRPRQAPQSLPHCLHLLPHPDPAPEALHTSLELVQAIVWWGKNARLTVPRGTQITQTIQLPSINSHVAFEKASNLDFIHFQRWTIHFSSC